MISYFLESKLKGLFRSQFMIRFKKLLVLIFLFTANVAGASYLDDWPDDALCGWMQQPSPPEHIVAEVKKTLGL